MELSLPSYDEMVKEAWSVSSSDRFRYEAVARLTLAHVTKQIEVFMEGTCPHHTYIDWRRKDCDMCKLELLEALMEAQR